MQVVLNVHEDGLLLLQLTGGCTKTEGLLPEKGAWCIIAKGFFPTGHQGKNKEKLSLCKTAAEREKKGVSEEEEG